MKSTVTKFLLKDKLVKVSKSESRSNLHLKSLIYSKERKSTKCEAFRRFCLCLMTNIAFLRQNEAIPKQNESISLRQNLFN